MCCGSVQHIVTYVTVSDMMKSYIHSYQYETYQCQAYIPDTYSSRSARKSPRSPVEGENWVEQLNV